MPRLIDSAGEPRDFCKEHFPKTIDIAINRYVNGLGEHDISYFEYNVKHRSYEHLRLAPAFVRSFHCETCDKKLTAEDD